MVEQTTFWEAGAGTIAADMSIRIHEITDPSNANIYCPVQEYRLSKIFRAKNNLHGYSRASQEHARIVELYKGLLSKTLCRDTVIFFPFYFSARAMGTNYEDKHQNQFRNFAACLRSKERDIPRILCIKDSVAQGRDAKTGTARHGIQIIKEEAMKAPDYPRAAEAFKVWLTAHPEIKNIIFTDFQTARYMYPAGIPKGGMLKNRYQVFKVFSRPEALIETGSRRSYNVIFAPSGLDFLKHKDGAFNTAADMLSIVMHPGVRPKMESRVVKNLDQLKEVIKYIQENNNGKFSLDTETTGLNPVIRGQSILSATVSIGRISWGFLVDHPRYPQYREEGLKMFNYILELTDVTIIMQNAKYDSKWSRQLFGTFPKAKRIQDTMIQDHWLNESLGSSAGALKLGRGYAMDTQIPRYLRIPSHKEMLDAALAKAKGRNPYKFPSDKALAALTVTDIRKIIEKVCSDDWLEPDSGKYAELSLHMLLKYMNYDGAYTYYINEEQERQISLQTGGELPKVLDDLQHRLIFSIADMELNGAPLNYDDIIDKIILCKNLVEDHGSKVREATGEGFDLNSDDQIIAYLKKYEHVTSDDLLIPKDFLHGERKEGLPGVIMKELAGRIPWMTDYMYYKKTSKVLNTYLIPFIFHSYKGNLYFSINITGTVTGRLSSDEPNIQNIPKALKLGKKFKMGVKEVIEAPKGRIFADLDLSSAEVKVLTAVCPDERLISVLKKGLDPHSYTATFNVDAPYDEIKAAHKKSDVEGAVLSEREVALCGERGNAKRVTFGAIYRAGVSGLAAQLSVTLDTSKANPSTGKPWTRLEIITEKQRLGEEKATHLQKKLFGEIYPELPKVFEGADIEVFNKHYSGSIFGRRRRFLGTDIPVISYLVKKAGLYSATGKSEFTIEDCKKLIGDQQPFRQALNHKVQSPTSDYMGYYICYLRENLPAALHTIIHFTVHDSVLFSFDKIENSRDMLVKVCDEGMNNYLMSLSDKLPVTIGYGMGVSSKYCEIPV